MIPDVVDVVGVAEGAGVGVGDGGGCSDLALSPPHPVANIANTTTSRMSRTKYKAEVSRKGVNLSELKAQVSAVPSLA
jgi:hypothetical protein